MARTVPRTGRRAATESRRRLGATGLGMVKVNIGPEGKKYVPYIFSLFTFILVSNLLGLLPLAVIPGMHSFTTTSHFSITGILAVLSFSIVLIVGFWRHKLHFFSLFVPHGTPAVMVPLIAAIEFISFMKAGTNILRVVN